MGWERDGREEGDWRDVGWKNREAEERREEVGRGWERRERG